MNPEEKPLSMPLRDWLIKQIAISKNLPSQVVEAIISHEFDIANQATGKYKSIEISGFGRFTFSEFKADYHLRRYASTIEHLNKHLQNPDLTDKQREKIMEKIESTTKTQNDLKNRL